MGWKMQCAGKDSVNNILKQKKKKVTYDTSPGERMHEEEDDAEILCVWFGLWD